MYYVVGTLIFIYIIGCFIVLAVTGIFLTSFLGSVFSAMLLSGIAAAELRTTNEIHFKYEMPDDQDAEFSQPIYLVCNKKFCGMTLITAEDMFETLEEAVSVYSITGDTASLKKILVNNDDKECQRVIKYYQFIYKKGNNKDENVADINDDLVNVSSLSTAEMEGNEEKPPVVERKQEEALPMGWTKLYTADGTPYYQNNVSRTTQWEPPTMEQTEIIYS